MNVLTIAANAVRRLLRDRAQLFFVFVFPLLLILMLGNSVAGPPTYRLVVVGSTDGPVASRIVETLSALDRVTVRLTDDPDDARQQVARGTAQGALLLPDDLESATGDARVEYVAGNGAASPMLRIPVGTALADAGAVVAAGRFAAEQTGTEVEGATRAAAELRAALPVTEAEVVILAGEDQVLPEYEEAGPLALITHQQLLLFTFLTSLTAASSLIQSRHLGVARRMLATPTSAGGILLGEALGRFGVALVQAIYIVVGTGLLFGVGWGEVSGWLPIVTLFAAVSAAAGMLIGATLRNDSQATGLGIFAGLALAAIGGCMLPLEFFSATMQRVAHVTPHAWALDAFRIITAPGAGVTDALAELGVLAVYAAVLLGLGTAALRRSLLRSV